jgi:glutamate/tyrosine decarboxylase-like PLP-dependent enzyme
MSPPAKLPAHGTPAPDVLAQLEALRTHDVRWREGRAFSLAYYGGPGVQSIAENAYKVCAGDNALNTAAFPSLRQMQADILAYASVWLGASEEAAGYFTSGGTESILMVMKAARDEYRTERGVTTPNVVLPSSAHATFAKGGAYFGIELRRVAVQDDWRANVAAMNDAIDDQTIMIIGSAPQYPQGVIDDIAALGQLALRYNINLHVDACMGGVSLAYLQRLGSNLQPWNFQVSGVTSMSVDLHKFGYTSKGASVIMYANKKKRSYQGFITDDWLGGMYASSGMLGTKSGGPIAAAWAVMNHLGDDGYEQLTLQAQTATRQLVEHLDAHAHLVLRARPDALLLSFGARDPNALDIFAVADNLWERGWYVDRQQPPPTLHCTVNAIHQMVMPQFLQDLDDCVELAISSGETGQVGQYGTM